MASPQDKRLFLAPRYWPTWILLAAMRLSAWLPYSLLVSLGSLLGSAAFFALKSRRHIAQTNIKLCFPDLQPTEQQTLCKNCFKSIGISIFETGLTWWGSSEKLKPLYQIEGLEHIEHAQQQGRPILLLSGHMSCTEIGGRLLAFHTPFQVMYKPAKNPLFEAMMQKYRGKIFCDMVSRKQSRRLLKNLKNKMVTWYGPDQNFGREETVFAPFFGVPATTLTATSRITKFADAVVLPFFPYRLPKQQGYRIIIGSPLKNFPTDSALEDATLVNRTIEEAVKLAPEQYLWLHKRFRLRPPGKPELY